MTALRRPLPVRDGCASQPSDVLSLASLNVRGLRVCASAVLAWAGACQDSLVFLCETRVMTDVDVPRAALLQSGFNYMVAANHERPAAAGVGDGYGLGWLINECAGLTVEEITPGTGAGVTHTDVSWLKVVSPHSGRPLICAGIYSPPRRLGEFDVLLDYLDTSLALLAMQGFEDIVLVGDLNARVSGPDLLRGQEAGMPLQSPELQTNRAGEQLLDWVRLGSAGFVLGGRWATTWTFEAAATVNGRHLSVVDHILASPSLLGKVQTAMVDNFPLSARLTDHCAVRVVISLSGPGGRCGGKRADRADACLLRLPRPGSPEWGRQRKFLADELKHPR